jgi:cytochrome c oxidase subunit 2
MLSPASAHPAQGLAEMTFVLIAGAALVFTGVMWLLAVVVWRRRARPLTRRQAAAWVLGGGVLLPAVVLSALLAYATVRSGALADTQRARGDMVVGITAHMWWWEVRYRERASGREVVLANEVRLPVGRAASFGLSTADVIHSFWVPQLAGKVDMVPGRVHQLRVRVDEAGSFRGQCAEYCGEQHARMALPVVAMPPDEFDRWLLAQSQPAQPPRSERARRGRQLFEQQRCNACHAVRGLVEAGPGQGPDLTHVGSRLALGAGTLDLRHENLVRWVGDVQVVKPGARMPSFDRLDRESLEALAAFLGELR